LQKQLSERTIGTRPTYYNPTFQPTITSPYTSNVSANRDYTTGNGLYGNTGASISTSRIQLANNSTN
jgi:hypothetical protein